MPIDLKPYLDPSTCAAVVFECQEHVIGSGSRIPGLVESVKTRGVVANIAELLARARKAGTRVFYCKAVQREGGLGAAKTPLHDRMERAAAPPGDISDTSIVKELAPEPGDVVLSRSHGMTAFFNTDLDPCLRDLGIQTVIPMGVSLNIGLIGTVIEAVNRGYRVIVPEDCAAGDPPEYGDQVLRYAIRNLAYVTTSGRIADNWG